MKKSKLLVLILSLLLLGGCSNAQKEGEIDPSHGEPSDIISNISIVYNGKLEYEIGDTFEKDKIAVNITYEDGHVVSLTSLTDVTVSGFDSSTASDSQIVTISYLNESIKVTVSIKKASTDKVLSSIYLTGPNKKTYEIGESLDLTGLVVYGKYSDNSIEVISTGYTVSGFNSSSAVVNQKITVSYSGLSTYFYVTINAKQEEDEDDFVRKYLYTGLNGKQYTQMELPKNHNNPIELKTTLENDASTWSNNSLKEDLPDYFRFIYGEAYDDGPTGSKASPSFYSSSNKAPGGLKFDQQNKGFQTHMFYHAGAKIEFRLGISQVNNCSDKPAEGKDIMRIYAFSKDGDILGNIPIPAESITTKTTELKYYFTDSYVPNIAYFEVRLYSLAYKGSQSYNVGIGYCNFKSFERV